MIDGIIKGFDVWTDAQGIKSKGRVKGIDNISLEGIARLRELILELAIQGKLIKQNQTDEIAEVQYKRINSQKEKLIKEGKLKKAAPSSELTSDEKQFEIPVSWYWCRLQDLVSILGDGIHGTPVFDDNGEYYFVNGNNLNNGVIEIKPETKRVSEIEFLKHKRELNNRTVLVSINGTIGNTAFYNHEKIILGKSACYFNLMDGIDKDYIRLLLTTKYFLEYALAEATGTTIKNVSLKTMRSLVVPLPPVEEQKRIVAKVNELMSLCDKLEEEQTKNLITHHHLVKCLLEKLTQANDADELQASWDKISEHFDTLFCTEDSVEQLKQTILQLAAMGKLTKQEPNDEIGSDVLNLVFKEKEKLAEKGIIKKPNKSIKISDDEKPFNIPEKWAWGRLSDTGIGSTGKTPSTSESKYFGGNIPFIGPGQITENGAICDSDKTLTEEGSEYSTIANTGDIIMVCIGGSIGKCAIVNSKIAFNQQLNCISPLIFNSKFLYNTFNAPFFKEQILKKATGSATPIINRGKWEEIVIPVPSITEQVRIVSRVNELFGICDFIKERISKSKEIKNTLSNCIIEVV